MLLNGSPLNGAPLNGTAEDGFVAGGAYPMQLGAPQLVNLGLNRSLTPPGLELVTHGLHTAQLSPIIPSAQSLTAGNYRPLELGAPALVPQATEATAGDALPMELGTHALGHALVAGDAEPLELGDAGPLGVSVTAGGYLPLELGSHSTAMVYRVPGLELVTWGVHTAYMEGASAEAGGALPLELGTPGPFGYSAITRSGFPMQLGSPTLTRGNAC